MKNFACAIVLAFTVWIHLPVCLAQGECLATSGCASQLHTIIEQPTGLINGTNSVFGLSATPSGDGKVQVFVDGLKLTEGSDFRRVDREITFDDGAIPQPGATVRAAFALPVKKSPTAASMDVKVGRRASALIRQLLIESALREVSPPPVASVPVPSTATIEAPAITVELPKQALNRQQKSPVAIVTKSPTIETSAVDPQVPAASQTVSAQVAKRVSGSFSLLARQMKRSDGGERSSKQLLKDHGQGYEGLGDLSSMSPYSILLQTETDDTNQTTKQPTTRGTLPHVALRSMSMLQKRLDASDEGDTTKKDGAR
jgi:hypothetical protein